MTSDPTPLLTEQVSDRYFGDYEQQWFCQPPIPGIPYRVTFCTWTPDYKIRKIFEISLGQGSQTR